MFIPAKRSILPGLISVLLLPGCTSKKQHTLNEVRVLSDYPSASGIEFSNTKYYVIGDDANTLLITDSSLNTIDSVSLYKNKERRIPKAIKADLESITVLPDNNLLVAGSGSLSPFRDMMWKINPITKQKDSLDAGAFYQRLKDNGIKELNLEGAASIDSSLILASRGSKGYPKNHLIFTSPSFTGNQLTGTVHITEIETAYDTSSFSGISGMEWSMESDVLILTVSTEDTRNNIDDGAIGKSYLWIINNISKKKGEITIRPDKIIDLETSDKRFKGYKIESVCITKETKESMELMLAADNDDGSSTLFRFTMIKE